MRLPPASLPMRQVCRKLGSSNLNNANEVFAAAYPAINWKPGKTLNGASKDEIKAWADEVVR